MLSFYNIEDDFSNFKGKDVIVFGASKGGQKVQEILKENGIEIKYFTDNNMSLYGTVVNGVEVISVEEIVDYCKNNLEKAVVQIGSMYDGEISEQLRGRGLENEIFFYEEFNIIYERKNFNKQFERDKELLVNKRMEGFWKVYKILGDELLRKIDEQKKNSEILYINYSPPKTGNTTITKTLKNYSKNSFNASHTLKYFENSILQKNNNEMKKIVIGIREPISQNISLLFEYVKEYRYIVPFEDNDRDAQKIFDKYFINTVAENDQYEEKVYSNKLEERQKNFMIQNWFDNELKKQLSIDIYNYEFDKERGYTIIKDNGKEILIYKLEKMNELEDVFGYFFQINDFKIIKDNISKEKWYSKNYKNFENNFKIPVEYLEKNYNSKFMKHFYSENEIKLLEQKWIRNIIR